MVEQRNWTDNQTTEPSNPSTNEKCTVCNESAYGFMVSFFFHCYSIDHLLQMSAVLPHFLRHLQEWERIWYHIHLLTNWLELLRKSKQFVCQFCKWLSCLLGSIHSFMSENDIPQSLKRSSPMSFSPHKKRAALIPFSECNTHQIKEKHQEESAIRSPNPAPQRFYRIRYVKCFNMAFEVLYNIEITCSM